MSRVQSALALSGRLRVGDAADIAELPPGKWLIVTGQTGNTWEDLLAEAHRAGRGEENCLETMAVLSTVNGTNWRRDTEGARWTTDTLEDFRSRLTALSIAAAEAGYEAEGRLSLTWGQAQHWLLTKELISPLAAEWKTWPWLTQKESELPWHREVEERMDKLDAKLDDFACQVMAAVEGAKP